MGRHRWVLGSFLVIAACSGGTSTAPLEEPDAADDAGDVGDESPTFDVPSPETTPPDGAADGCVDGGDGCVPETVCGDGRVAGAEE